MLAVERDGFDERILKHVTKILSEKGIQKPVSPEDNLTNTGLTSLNMLNLMMAVEAEFNIAVPQAEITTENFTSVASIRAMVLRLLP